MARKRKNRKKSKSSQQNFKITEDKISVFEKKISNLADFLFSETLNKILVNLHNEQKQNYKT